MAAQDLHTRVADQLTDWLEGMPQRIAERWTGNGRAPFAQQVSTAKALAYYNRTFYNPDGTPNVQGRNAELERLGVDGYAKAMRAVMKHRTEGTLTLEAQDPPATPGAQAEMQVQGQEDY